MDTLTFPQTIARRIDCLQESQTLEMAKKARELSEKGFDIINLSLGEPDFPTPDHIIQATIAALNENKYTKYTPVSGYLDLRKAISHKFKRDNNLNYSTEQIVVSTGAKQSIANAILSLVNPGDEVLIPMPYWVSYSAIVQLAEGVPVFIPATLENDFKITPKQLSDSITNRTRLLIYSSPCNPTGSVLTKSDLAGWVEVLKKYENIVVVSDEIYEFINFTGNHASMAQFDEIADRVVTVNGLSKCFAMTGWRIGYIGAPKWIASACEKVQGQFTSGACSIAQRAAIAALTSDLKPTLEMTKIYKRRRDLMFGLLNEIPGFNCNLPQGAFYIFADVSYYFGKSSEGYKIKSAHDLCYYLIESANVVIVSGEAFGDPKCIRFVYALSDEKIVEAMKRIKTALYKLK